jgi:hypothetical protein
MFFLFLMKIGDTAGGTGPVCETKAKAVPGRPQQGVSGV